MAGLPGNLAPDILIDGGDLTEDFHGEQADSSLAMASLGRRPDLLPGVEFSTLGHGVAEMCKGPSGLYDTAKITGPAEDLADSSPHSPARRKWSNVQPMAASNQHSQPVWGPSTGCNLPVLDGTQKGVAILTSGGDAPGMNAAVRSCVAVCLAKRVKVFSIQYGYKGLVDGGDNIKEIDWGDISDIMHKGGTVIGSARCPEMRTKEGRLKAAHNLAKLGVNRLVVIGGDGSLTGAELFKTEWPDLLDTLEKAGELDHATVAKLPNLCIIGMVGSIDNDMCGFTTTIGADTALKRIVDACDALITTAQSHRRTFIVEVMGRHCGHLALMASIAVGADWVFIPECPPDTEDWETTLCEMLARRPKNENYCLVIVSEGATDRVRRPIEAQYLKSILEQRLGHDTRVTTLGHVQRGGAPTAYDRLQGTRLGAEAAFAILAADDSTPSRVVGFRHRNVIQIGLTPAVEVTKSLARALEARDYERAIKMRGMTFKTVLNLFLETREFLDVPQTGNRICVVHSGAPAAGMNAVTKIVVRKLINNGHRVYGARNGFPGMSQGAIDELFWWDVAGWSGEGGCKLGTNRVQPDRVSGGDGIRKIAAMLREFGIQALVVIGGFEAYHSALSLTNARPEFRELCIPIVSVPVTISNNVPGTAISVGVDTALNAIVESVDRLKLSAASSRARLFLIEVMGDKCGFLAVMAALAGGADSAYIHENVVSIETMQGDVAYLRRKFAAQFKKALIVRNEHCSHNYDMPFMQAVFEQEGTRRNEVSYTVRNSVLGHLQQGNRPTPYDRVRAARLASATVDFVMEKLGKSESDGVVYTDAKESAVMAGAHEHAVVFTPLVDMVPKTDFTMRRPKEHWFVNLQELIKLLELNNDDTWGDDVQYQPMATVLSDDEILVDMD